MKIKNGLKFQLKLTEAIQFEAKTGGFNKSKCLLVILSLKRCEPRRHYLEFVNTFIMISNKSHPKKNLHPLDRLSAQLMKLTSKHSRNKSKKKRGCGFLLKISTQFNKRKGLITLKLFKEERNFLIIIKSKNYKQIIHEKSASAYASFPE